MQFFSKICNFFSKICNFFSKICNFSQKYAIFLKNMQFFSQKICIGKCLKFSYTYKKNAIHIAYKNKFATIQKSRFLLENGDIKTFFYMPPDHSLLCKIYMYIKRPIFKTLMFLCAIANGASKIAFSHSRSS